MTENKPQQPALNGWDEAERQQVLHIARNTTPLQRLQWVNDMMVKFQDQLRRQSEIEWARRIKEWNGEKT